MKVPYTLAGVHNLMLALTESLNQFLILHLRYTSHTSVSLHVYLREPVVVKTERGLCFNVL